ncbi:MAG: hypothetical protein JRN20_00760 [Nitrososphaerota archaeon]|jgi:hypothetical protein|nr:hypothetical protein [Nitrososphaerota archaeon]MDG6924282.1 hypothetical protein [Nitrososphaerota archaeon]
MEISISKEVLPSLQGYELTETALGDPKDSVRQFRNLNGLHVREYDDRFEIHKDEVDPRVNPIGHLIRDSPETILALGAALVSTSSRSKKQVGKGSFNPFVFFLSFLSINRILVFLKRFF